MAMSPYIRELRSLVGHRLLLLPSVAVLPRDPDGRVLLVRQPDGDWITIGGLVEPDESPEDAAAREAREEAGIELELGTLLACVGGPDYRVRYANGDEVSYVSAVFDATVRAGTPRPDGDETVETAWFRPDELVDLPMNGFNRALFRDLAVTEGDDSPRR